MRTENPVTIHLKDYAPTDFIVHHIDMTVALDPKVTRVQTEIKMTRRGSHERPLVFDGDELKLEAVFLDGKILDVSNYTHERGKLTVRGLPDRQFVLGIVQYCNPHENTALSGLYLSSGMYCTQMEAEGFRRFAFMYDRPDVMATYRVRIEAPNALPVLLSNGNPVEHGEIAGSGRHFATWEDPHPKPSYLFALVGGDLASMHDSFVTKDGRTVALGIYVEKGKEDRCSWAMESLKASMTWDEKRFGRAYDLEVFNIVAVSDFNMGAMENKGLNIFNDKYILARPDTATDTDYVNIERIIAHEYFHNWTGNRITCRDWFQLCLKEGLTVFRDQEFTSDLRSRAVKRIDDVKTLRARQFPEDQGPLSHPVRPSSYIEINNFYTPTVYEKGAELCRMIHTLIGEAAFRKAMDLYFARHDGEAATVEDFLRCMADASGRDLTHFAQWYSQSGTPVVTVRTTHDEKRETFTLEISQCTPALPGQPAKMPLHFPIALGLVNDNGQDLPLALEGFGSLNSPILEMTQESQSFCFTGVKKRPHLSINRAFTAPIILNTDATASDLLFLMGNDSDSFNRWEAAQTLARELLVKSTAAIRSGLPVPDSSDFAEALRKSIRDNTLDDAFKAFMMQLPSEAEIAGAIGNDVDATVVHEARELVRRDIGKQIVDDLSRILKITGEDGPYLPDIEGTARRSLRYASLALLAAADDALAVEIAARDFESASCMTSEIGALSSVLGSTNANVSHLLDAFYARHNTDHLLVDKWFMLQAQHARTDAAKHVEALTRHPDFRYGTPNRVYALIGGFSGGNIAAFHAADGTGYRLVADAIAVLNGINPQVAARMATSFRSWRQYDAPRRMQAELQMKRILDISSLSRDVYEIISRTLLS